MYLQHIIDWLIYSILTATVIRMYNTYFFAELLDIYFAHVLALTYKLTLFMAVTVTTTPSSIPNGKVCTVISDRVTALESKKWAPRDILYASFYFAIHVLCLFAPFTFSWGALATAWILSIITGMFGVTLSYHRNLAHQSFKLPKYLEYLFAYFALHSFQGDPIFWVSMHRYHHKVTDTERDPHSPVTEGLYFAHIGWAWDHKKMVRKGMSYNNVRDLTGQTYYRFLEKTLVFHAYGMAALLYLIGGLPYIVWGMGVRLVYIYNVTFVVNSICHTWGHRAWNTEDSSKNNWMLSLVTFGESWHNNHHAFQYSARQGLEWWQIDPTWYVIKGLEYLGLATDVRLPSDAHKKKMSL